MPRHVLPLLLSLLLPLPVLCGCADGEQKARDGTLPSRPNVLILFTDDQRYNTVHALGNDEIVTPNMDRLVAEGTSFTRAHIQGGMHGALCAPSRAMLLTGRRLFSLQESGDVIPAAHVMMPEQFAAAGYTTFGTGKWHNNKQAYARAFSAGDNIFFGGMHWPRDGGHESPLLHAFDASGIYPAEARRSVDGFSSTLFADAAVDFIRSRKSEDSPFFAYVAFSSPHDPRTPRQPFDALYSGESVSLPPNYLPEHPFDNGELKVRDEMLLPHPRTIDAVRSDLAKYYGMVSEVDAAIGRVLEAVESIGQLENTIIVFAGDNGLAVGSHGLLGKQNLYDHSMRVPLVIRGPGVPKGEQRDALVYLFDLFRTVADLSGVEAADTAEGESLVPLLRDKKKSVRESVFYAYRDLQRGVRTSDDWKMIRYNVGGEEHVQLFDLNVDPYELNNLGDDPSAEPQYRRLTSLLVSESEANNDRVNLSAPNWGKPPPERAQNVEHVAVGASVALSNAFSKKYPGRGAAGLVDGVVCTSDFKADCWHGLEGEDLEAVLDLGSAVTLSKVSARFIRNNGAWIFLPLQLQVSSSVDGIRWERIATMKTPPAAESDTTEVRSLSSRFRPHEARFIKVQAVNRGTCPPWHAGAGGKAWMFVDEIELR